MRLGILLSPDPSATSVAAGFNDQIATARRAEEQGYSSVWIGESHFGTATPEPVPLVFGGALAAETESIRLGVMVKLVLEHPVKIAEDAAVLDVMSGGRLLFGADPGASAEECAGYGVQAAERMPRFTEALDIIVNAWTSDAFAYRGEYYTLPRETNAVGAGYVAEPYAPPYVDPWQRVDQPFDYLSVLPKPAQIPRPPVFVVTDDDDAAELAANNAYSPILPESATLEQLVDRANAFWRALDAAGRARSETVLSVARGIYLHDAERSEASVDENVIAGTPAEVLHHIKQLQHDTGLGQILCRFDLPGVTSLQAARSLELFASDVRSRLEM